MTSISSINSQAYSSLAKQNIVKKAKETQKIANDLEKQAQSAQRDAQQMQQQANSLYEKSSAAQNKAQTLKSQSNLINSFDKASENISNSLNKLNIKNDTTKNDTTNDLNHSSDHAPPEIPEAPVTPGGAGVDQYNQIQNNNNYNKISIKI